MALGKLDAWKNIKLDQQLIPYTRINSEQIKYLQTNHKTIKIIEKNLGSEISDISHTNIAVITPIRQGVDR